MLLYDKTKEKSDFKAYPVSSNRLYSLGENKYRFSVYDKENFDINRLKDYEVCSWDIEKNYENTGDEVRINIK